MDWIFFCNFTELIFNGYDMNKYVVFLVVALLATAGFANKSDKKLRANIAYTTFYSPTDGPYVETYLSINANSIQYHRTADGQFQGAVEVMMIFKQEDTVFAFDKKELLSLVVKDTLEHLPSFFDVQRFVLPAGMFVFDLTISDKYSDNKAFNIQQDVEINYNATDAMVSGIELIESYVKTTEPNVLTKSGIDMMPTMSSYLGPEFKKLIFYSEIYNVDKHLASSDKYMLKYYIKPAETASVLDKYTRIKREEVKPVNVLFAEFDIADLPSGNYYLCVECRDKDNKMFAFNSLYFQRNNPDVEIKIDDLLVKHDDEVFTYHYKSADTLREYLRCLRPIAMGSEMNYLTKKAIAGMDLRMMQEFFYSFWYERDKIDPEKAWVVYRQEVGKVNKNYGNQIEKGYETDMGRVYLQYGPPDAIVDRPYDASSWDGKGYVPYQIWQYYALKDQRNRKFVFGNLNLTHNGFKLLHSDAIGEPNNPNWETELQRGTNRKGAGDMKVDPNSSPGRWYNNPY